MMPLSKDELEELDFLYRLNILIERFRMRKRATSKDLNIIMESFERFYKPKNARSLKAFRIALDDSYRILRGMDQFERVQLNKILMKELNVSVDSILRKHVQKIRSIVARNKINNADEYRIMQDYIDDVQSERAAKDVLDKFHDLLLKYERSGEAEK